MSFEKLQKADKLMRQGKSGQAVTIIKEVIKVEPDMAYAHYLLGVARLKCCRFFLAHEALLKADQLDPNNPSNLRSLGYVKIMLGKIEEGRNDLRRSINLDLTNVQSYTDLAMSYFDHLDFKEGFNWLDRAVALNPKDKFISYSLKQAKKLNEEFEAMPQKQKAKMLKEKNDLEAQRVFRLQLLAKYTERKGLTRDEAEEIQKEASFNGLSAAIMKDAKNEYLNYDGKNTAQRVDQIERRRKEIENDMVRMLKERKSDLTVEQIKEIIYNEKDDKEFTKLISFFDTGGGIDEVEEILDVLNDAWNYFPHKCLGGLCPMEKISEANHS